MGLFNFFKKVEKKNESKKVASSFSASSAIYIKGVIKDVDTSEIVDFDEHEEVSDDAKKQVIEYISSLTGKIYYNPDRFHVIRDSPFVCNDVQKTRVWLQNLIDYDLVTISCRYNENGNLINLECAKMPEYNCSNAEQLVVIQKELNEK